jgi:hypothetical protein
MGLCPLFSEVRTIESFTEIEHELLAQDCHTLIVFDVDEVLITAKDQALKTPHKDVFRKIAREYFEKAQTPAEKKMIEYRLSLTYLYPSRILVEKLVVPMIRQLQQKGIYVMGITRCRSGRYGIIPEVEHWRKEVLLKRGIDFDNGAFDSVRCVLSQEDSNGRKTPKFEDGLLFGRGYPKDYLVAKLIHDLNLEIYKVYMIDDERSKLLNLDYLQNYEVHPIEYTGAKKFLRKISLRQVNWQVSKLLQTGRWYEDEDIEELGIFGGFFRYHVPSFWQMLFG